MSDDDPPRMPAALDEPPVPATRLQPRGSSQGGLRQYNERVVLQAIRLRGALPAAEIARLTGLTAQTVSLITKRLLDDGLLRRGAPVRGKVGQPSVPLSLAPEGAYSVGIKVGRRSLDVLLVDFTGSVCERWSREYRFPDPDELLAEIGQRLADIHRKLGTAQRDRVQGVGIAAPLAIGGWQSLLGFPPALAARWDGIDLRQAVAALTDWPVTLMKDTAAACVAELVAGRGRTVRSFLYVFVDTFIGGGLVLDSRMRVGPSGNAGAFGSLPLGRADRATTEPPPQMLSVASLLSLERAWGAAGLDDGAATRPQALQAPWRGHTDAWLADAGAAIAQGINTATCLLDLDGVILDGSFSRELLAELRAATQQAMDRYSWEGVSRPALEAGVIGSDARALGGALLPLYANFAPDSDLFLKLEA